MLSSLDKSIIKKLQEDLPLVPEPYKQIAEEVEISEDELFSKIREFKKKKIIRKFGSTLNHRRVGYRSNAMVVWNIPGEKITEAAGIMISYPQVSHCYQRVTLPNWQYNIFTMVHGKDENECKIIAEEIAEAINIKDYCLLYSTVELKKCSMKYFLD